MALTAAFPSRKPHGPVDLEAAAAPPPPSPNQGGRRGRGRRKAGQSHVQRHVAAAQQRRRKFQSEGELAHFFWTRCRTSFMSARYGGPQEYSEAEGYGRGTRDSPLLLDVIGMNLCVDGGEELEPPLQEYFLFDGVRLTILVRQDPGRHPSHFVLVDLEVCGWRGWERPPPTDFEPLRYTIGPAGPALGSTAQPWQDWAHVLGDVPWPALPDAFRGCAGPLSQLLLSSPVTGERFTAAILTIQPGGRVALSLHSWNVYQELCAGERWYEDEFDTRLQDYSGRHGGPRLQQEVRRSAVLVPEDPRGFLSENRMEDYVDAEYNPIPELVPPARLASERAQLRNFLLHEEMDGGYGGSHEHYGVDEFDVEE